MKDTEFGSREGTFLHLHPRFLSNFLFFFHYFVSSWVLLDQIRRAAIRAIRSWTFIAHVLEMHLILSKTHSPDSSRRRHFRTILGSKSVHASPELFSGYDGSFSRFLLSSLEFSGRVLSSISSDKVFRSHSDM